MNRKCYSCKEVCDIKDGHKLHWTQKRMVKEKHPRRNLIIEGALNENFCAHCFEELIFWGWNHLPGVFKKGKPIEKFPRFQ